MIDFEVMKTETGYVVQVTDKKGPAFYSVDDKQRHLSKDKLLKLFNAGEIKPVLAEKAVK